LVGATGIEPVTPCL